MFKYVIRRNYFGYLLFFLAEFPGLTYLEMQKNAYFWKISLSAVTVAVTFVVLVTVAIVVVVRTT